MSKTTPLPWPLFAVDWVPTADAVKKALDEWGVTKEELYSLYVPWKLRTRSPLPALASKAMDTPQYHPHGKMMGQEIGGADNIRFLDVIRKDPEALKKFLVELKTDLEKKLRVDLPKQPPPFSPLPSLADQGFTPFHQQQQQPTFTSSSMEGGGGRLLPEQQQPSSPEQQPSSPEQQQLSYQQQQQLSYQQQQLSYQQQQQPTFTSSPMEGGGGCLLPQQPFYYQQQQPFYYQQQPPFPLSPLFPPQPSLPHDVCLALSHLYANVFLPPSGNL